MQQRARARRIRTGAILLDSMVGIFVLALAAVSFFSLFPVMYRSQLMAEQQTKAIHISSRIIEHLQLLKAANVNAQTLSQLNLIDANQGQSPYSFSHIPMDEASLYSPAQTLPNGQGTLTVTNLNGGSVLCVIRITWTGNGGQKSYTSGTVVGGYR